MRPLYYSHCNVNGDNKLVSYWTETSCNPKIQIDVLADLNINVYWITFLSVNLPGYSMIQTQEQEYAHRVVNTNAKEHVRMQR